MGSLKKNIVIFDKSKTDVLASIGGVVLDNRDGYMQYFAENKVEIAVINFSGLTADDVGAIRYAQDGNIAKTRYIGVGLRESGEGESGGLQQDVSRPELKELESAIPFEALISIDFSDKKFLSVLNFNIKKIRLHNQFHAKPDLHAKEPSPKVPENVGLNSVSAQSPSAPLSQSLQAASLSSALSAAAVVGVVALSAYFLFSGDEGDIESRQRDRYSRAGERPENTLLRSTTTSQLDQFIADVETKQPKNFTRDLSATERLGSADDLLEGDGDVSQSPVSDSIVDGQTDLQENITEILPENETPSTGVGADDAASMVALNAGSQGVLTTSELAAIAEPAATTKVTPTNEPIAPVTSSEVTRNASASQEAVAVTPTRAEKTLTETAQAAAVSETAKADNIALARNTVIAEPKKTTVRAQPVRQNSRSSRSAPAPNVNAPNPEDLATFEILALAKIADKSYMGGADDGALEYITKIQQIPGSDATVLRLIKSALINMLGDYGDHLASKDYQRVSQVYVELEAVTRTVRQQGNAFQNNRSYTRFIERSLDKLISTADDLLSSERDEKHRSRIRAAISNAVTLLSNVCPKCKQPKRAYFPVDLG